MSKINYKSGFLFACIILSLFYLSSFYLLIDGKIITNTVTLDPLEEHVVAVKLHDDDTLYISGDVTSGTIDLGIFDSENYPNPSYYEQYYYDLTSTFTREFNPLWTDTFYLEFYNPSTTNPATVSYTLEHETTFSTNLIINISIATSFLGVIVVLNFTGKKT